MKTSRIVSFALAGLMAVSAFGGVAASAATVKAPKTVKAANVAKGVKLTWTKVKGAKYNVYRGKTLIKKAVKTNTFTDAKAAAGKTYTYKVKAVKGKTAGKAASVKATRLTKPVIKSLAVVSNGIKAKWSKVKGATKYDLYKRTAGEKKYTKVVTTAKNAYTDKKASANKKAVYKVKAYATKTKMYSVFSATKTSPAFLAAPTIKEPVIVSKDGNVKVEWNAVPTATSYTIFKGEGVQAKEFTEIGTVKETSFTDVQYKNPTAAVYKVVANSAKATSAAAMCRAIVLPNGCYYTDADKNLNVNIKLGVGEEYLNGSFVIASIEVSAFVDPSYTYSIENVKGEDVASFEAGAIKALKAGEATYKVTLSAPVVEMFGDSINELRALTGEKLSNDLSTGVVYVNVTVE